MASSTALDLELWRTTFFTSLRKHLEPEPATQTPAGLTYKCYSTTVEQSRPGIVEIIVSDRARDGDEVYVLEEPDDAEPFSLAWLTAIWLKASL